ISEFCDVMTQPLRGRNSFSYFSQGSRSGNPGLEAEAPLGFNFPPRKPRFMRLQRILNSRSTMTAKFSRLVLMNLSKTRTLATLLLITQLLWPISTSASVRYVWAVNDGEKV